MSSGSGSLRVFGVVVGDSLCVKLNIHRLLQCTCTVFSPPSHAHSQAPHLKQHRAHNAARRPCPLAPRGALKQGKKQPAHLKRRSLPSMALMMRSDVARSRLLAVVR